MRGHDPSWAARMWCDRAVRRTRPWSTTPWPHPRTAIPAGDAERPSPMTRRHRSMTRVLLVALVVVLAAAACGDDDDDDPGAADGSASTAAAATGDGAATTIEDRKS